MSWRARSEKEVAPAQMRHLLLCAVSHSVVLEAPDQQILLIRSSQHRDEVQRWSVEQETRLERENSRKEDLDVLRARMADASCRR